MQFKALLHALGHFSTLKIGLRKINQVFLRMAHTKLHISATSMHKKPAVSSVLMVTLKHIIIDII